VLTWTVARTSNEMRCFTEIAPRSRGGLRCERTWPIAIECTAKMKFQLRESAFLGLQDKGRQTAQGSHASHPMKQIERRTETEACP
jgi:hypothetical protein